jgi:hypothetical protein
MRTLLLASLTSLTAAFATALLLVACGGAKPGAEGAKTPTGGGSDPSQSPSASSSGGGGAGDAGPTTTTTLTLADGGDLTGSKLTQSGSTTIDTTIDGGERPHGHTSEPGRSARDIQAIIVARRDEARACYDSAVKTHPGIQGDVDIQWTIDPKGNVVDISEDASRSQIFEKSVVDCIVTIIKKIHFNESAKGFETKTHYPFNFHPRSGGVMVVQPGGGGN